MSEHEATCNLLANILAAQNQTTEAVVKLAEALAGIRAQKTAGDTAAAKAEAAKVEATSATAAAATPITYEQVRDRIVAIPKEDARLILAELGVKKLSEMKAEDFPKVMAELDARA